MEKRCGSRVVACQRSTASTRQMVIWLHASRWAVVRMEWPFGHSQAPTHLVTPAFFGEAGCTCRAFDIVRGMRCVALGHVFQVNDNHGKAAAYRYEYGCV